MNCWVIWDLHPSTLKKLHPQPDHSLPTILLKSTDAVQHSPTGRAALPSFGSLPRGRMGQESQNMCKPLGKKVLQIKTAQLQGRDSKAQQKQAVQGRAGTGQPSQVVRQLTNSLRIK